MGELAAAVLDQVARDHRQRPAREHQPLRCRSRVLAPLHRQVDRVAVAAEEQHVDLGPRHHEPDILPANF